MTGKIKEMKDKVGKSDTEKPNMDDRTRTLTGRNRRSQKKDKKGGMKNSVTHTMRMKK